MCNSRLKASSEYSSGSDFEEQSFWPPRMLCNVISREEDEAGGRVYFALAGAVRAI